MPKTRRIQLILNVVLGSIFLVGLIQSILLRQDYLDLVEQQQQYKQIYGEFPESDNSSVRVIKVQTDEPLVFKFRFYLPPGHSCLIAHTEFGSGTGTSGVSGASPTEASECIYTICLSHNTEYDKLDLNVTSEAWIAGVVDEQRNARLSAIGGSFLDREVSRFVLEHRDDLIFSSDQTEGKAIEPGKEFTLFKIAVPESLADEFPARALERRNMTPDFPLSLLEIRATVKKQ
ncbi:MAG: hypothetical protein AAF456_15350 [Planctomycetota bacterium]